MEGVAAHLCRDERESDRCPRRRGGGGRRREREDGRRHAGNKKGCVCVCARARVLPRSDSGGGSLLRCRAGVLGVSVERRLCLRVHKSDAHQHSVVLT